jgi:hypothetical protein
LEVAEEGGQASADVRKLWGHLRARSSVHDAVEYVTDVGTVRATGGEGRTRTESSGSKRSDTYDKKFKAAASFSAAA